jgi:hypothetical protein
MKKSAIIFVNSLLVVIIILIILATWLPAIYTSQWFQNDHWVKVHLLHNETPEGKPIRPPNE